MDSDILEDRDHLYTRRKQGFSLVELLVVLSIMAIGLSIAALNLRPLSAPLKSATNGVAGTFRQARTKAMSTTSAYRVSPSSTTRLIVETAKRCNSAASEWVAAPQFSFDLEENIVLSDTEWQLCFTSRGTVGTGSAAGQSVQIIDPKDPDNRQLTVTTLIAGGIEIE